MGLKDRPPDGDETGRSLAGCYGGAPQIMTRAAHAETPPSQEIFSGIRTFQLGQFEVTAIRDGGRAMEGPHPIFGEDQEADVVAELPAGETSLPADRFVNGVHTGV